VVVRDRVRDLVRNAETSTMSGYLWAMSECVCCHHVFSFDPERVPSIRIAGVREPICRTCVVGLVNPRRVANGLAPIVPLPGAYVDELDPLDALDQDGDR